MKGMGSLYLRGSTWWMTFNRNGRQFRLSSGTDNKSIAKGRLKQEVQKALGAAFIPPDKRRVTIADLVADLLTHFARVGKTAFGADCRVRWENRLKATFENVRAPDLGTAAMNAYRDEWAGKARSHTTINRDLQVLRRAYRLAAECEPPKVERVPKFVLLREDNARKVFISEEQVDKLRMAASREGLWARVLIEMAYLYGWRKGELLSLRTQDVNLAENCIRLQTSKNGDPREVPVTPSIALLLGSLLAGDGLLFPSIDFRSFWRRLCQAIGATPGKRGITFHDFRRTAARSKRAAGVSTSVIMELQGWKTEAMFRRYAITDNADKLDALRRQEESRNITTASHPEVPATVN